MAFQASYINPKLPFTGLIEGIEGKTISVTGWVIPGAERFQVDLQCGTQASADIALHFNPRYSGNSGYVVCNTRQSSSWGPEERSSPTPIPRGSNFNVTFLINRNSYSVVVNGVHFKEYLHRIPFSSVNAISVRGGVDIQSISFPDPAVTKSDFANFSYMVKPSCANPGLMAGPPPYSAPETYIVPYKAVIQGGFYPGKVIMVQGFVNYDADRFSINLRHNSGIAFHFNPRFNENVVVRNSLMKEQWGCEEREGGLPFYKGQQFTVSIMCEPQCYRIIVNGVQMFTYNHRYSLFREIDILEVTGNISLNSVTA
ncbi:galectin-9-like isoform X2 [Trichomycterus rosablanca]|uniref:galectin-9-like isoform X2 n=1 Tax=Trichomycterus rosablanca TaxID=2290929 RepID=UPI002F3527E3